jgi:hypothetical protein
MMITNNAGSTPTETTLLEVEKNGNLKDATRNNYVLLITDGIPTCNQDGRVTNVITGLYNGTPSVRTFVVGIGDGTSSNPQQLNQWADAGRTARVNQPTKYFQANNVTELQGAFADIIAGIASCTYQLASAPPESNLLVPYIDGKPVANDQTNGYTFDSKSNSVTFHGMACDLVKMGASKIDIIYGCPSPPIL